jgi:lysophospholipase L1-like esterase
MGRQIEKPKPTYEVGFSASGDASYDGLCDFACNLGFCPSTSCSKTKHDSYIPPSSPFNPATCTHWTGSGANAGLCDYGCNFGFCPRAVCTCTKTGPLNLPPKITNNMSWKVFRKLNDHGLCHFACIRGYCPDDCKAIVDRENAGKADFTWIQRYAALGDSFAAGIGIGSVSTSAGGAECSRYNGAYPLKIQQVVQSQRFLFKACSGDTSQDILEKQIPNIPGDNELITVSAGGNDVGFSAVLKKCILLPSSSSDCQSALVEAEAKIDGLLNGNIIKLLNAISPRLSPKGVIVWTLYAKFFDETPLPCNKQ